MGILNVTPDSFSDGGRYTDLDAALRHAGQMISEGAAIIDVGGESTRPGAGRVAEREELRRILPVIAALRESTGATISIDTSKPAIMEAAVGAGAGMINDVFALRTDGALEAAARLGAHVCLVHMRGVPGTMQVAPRYEDVVSQVLQFLAERVHCCEQAGIARDRIIVDPGFGFGKTDVHNLLLLRKLDALQQLELPIMVGLSRKGTLGSVTGRPAGERLAAGVAAATIAVTRGASIVRTHDVAATVDALRLVGAMRECG
jgi:dihydropteroate synthase